VKEKRDEFTLGTVTFLEGDFHDEFLQKKLYWGKGSRITHIVIGTGTILITGVEDHFHNGITEVDPDLSISLNHRIKVEGIGRVQWKMQDQLGQIEVVATAAYLIPDAQVHLFSPQLYFNNEQDGSCT
jgi:hypothetical protein